MSKDIQGGLIIAGYYALVVSFGFLLYRPKLVFYLSILIGIAACVFMFSLKIYVEMGGLAHTLPFALVGWQISRIRLKHKIAEEVNEEAK
ncbi:MAG: hypothetical protein AAB370_02125 [Verrucomicrobiota bacterium]